MSAQWYAYPDAKGAAEACAACIVARLESVLAARDTATLAISGGNSPKPMFQELTMWRLPWDRVHVFWVDERAVPPSDPESNYRAAAELFVLPCRIPQRNVHRVRAELRPDVAARLYADDIKAFFGLGPGDLPHFDVMHRGMGPDGHTASLFPGEPMIDDREGLTAAVYKEDKEQWRITMLPGVILAAENTVMLVTGEDKAEKVREVFYEPYDPKRIPAQLAADNGHAVTWFLDEPAAKSLTTETV